MEEAFSHLPRFLERSHCPGCAADTADQTSGVEAVRAGVTQGLDCSCLWKTDALLLSVEWIIALESRIVWSESNESLPLNKI